MKRQDSGRPPRGKTPRSGSANYSDPYQKARRPRPDSDDAPRFSRRPRADEGGGAPRARPRGGREAAGFTVTLDPDVARVFRGDASVNKALRLVLQLTQVVQGPRPFSAPSERPRGYQGSAEARGFQRKPRFEDDAQ